ncbi:MAG: hypothetical protein J1F42_12460 [Lachnospiraceae bacterium]|nr:hypothetical protein [Lachnospiraceae bacterium]
MARLDELFGSYKAEWLNEKIFHFFAAPSYFTSLKDKRPCVLMGGRGTGKTTVLRGLSYKGQYALNNDDIDKFDLNSYIGVYFRCDTNHVHAFSGKGIDDETWMKIFAHYFNLILTSEILEFIAWHKELKPDDDVLPKHACCLIATSLHLGDDISDYRRLMNVLEMAMYKFQADINNIADGNMPKLSLAGDPIKIVTEQARKLKQFRDKTFYLLIDEYENLLDSQQKIVNTLLKHIPQSYTIKIGVREMGWRVKHTMNPHESVIDPADYVLFNIVGEFIDETPDKFESFARNVCQLRIKDLLEEDGVDFNIEQALGNLPYEEEAVKLGVEQTSLYENILEYEKESGMNLDVSPLYKFFLSYWSENHNRMLEDEIADYLSNTTTWNTRYENYKYSLLFKIRTGRGSSGIQKYYAGWNTFVKLANGNIRYLMELVYRSYYLYLQEGGDIAEPISADIQTKAARNVGWKNLTELEGAWNNGAQLTRMVQTLGTIFSRLAKESENSAPEIVQFEIEGKRSERTEELLQAGIMNLALIRMPANKQSGRGSVKEFMYSLHPIFAPYFIYSFRRKRKMELSDAEFLLCVDNPKDAVKTILNKRNVRIDEERAVMDQLSFDFWD